MTIVDLARERIQANARGCLVPDDVEALTIESRLGIEELMLQLTPLAASFAMPPVSEFRVGAVVQGISGAMYLGANIEFLTCALNQTVHAEQAAVTNAAVHREASIIRLAVSAAPCGYCRQFLLELVDGGAVKILQPNQPPCRLSELLPAPFGPADLGIEAGLLGRPSHALAPHTRPKGEAASVAWEAMEISYAPYSRAFAGAALQTRDGRVFAGPYLENVAFNPSLPPMQAAVIMAALSGYGADDFVAAALAQPKDSRIDHAPGSHAILACLSPGVDLQTFLIAVD